MINYKRNFEEKNIEIKHSYTLTMFIFKRNIECIHFNVINEFNGHL